MKLELQKVSFSEALSEDSSAFTADVYIDGVKRATAKNSGHGGPTSVDAYAKPRKSPVGDEAYFTERKGNQVFLDQYEAWAAQLPPIETNLPGEGEANFSYAHSLEADVDLLLEQWLKDRNTKKDEARLKRMCKTKWVFSLKEDKGKPCDPNTIFTIARNPAQQLAVVGRQLRERHGENLLEFLNERYA